MGRSPGRDPSSRKMKVLGMVVGVKRSGWMRGTLPSGTSSLPSLLADSPSIPSPPVTSRG